MVATQSVEAVWFSFLTDEDVRKHSFLKITEPQLLDQVDRPLPAGGGATGTVTTGAVEGGKELADEDAAGIPKVGDKCGEVSDPLELKGNCYIKLGPANHPPSLNIGSITLQKCKHHTRAVLET
ncbi:hypothetical protein ACOSQ2_017180 [Xanthoceras sorbifolium]